MKTVLMACLVLTVSGTARAQDHAACPMMAQHQAQVDHRHESATSVPSAGTVHHFVLADDGGEVRLETTAEGAIETRDRVRAHLQQIARAFAAGDFSMPTQIHEQVPPGVETMKTRRDAIRFTYAESPRGGFVTIATRDAQALEAVHDFLRFQIRDHATGDPID